MLAPSKLILHNVDTMHSAQKVNTVAVKRFDIIIVYSESTVQDAKNSSP